MSQLPTLGAAPKGRRFTAALLGAAALAVSSAMYGGLATNGASHVLFTATQADVPVDGEFRKFSADAVFAPTKPEAGKVNFVVEVGSVDTGSGDADQLLRGKEFFDAARYPQATFTSKVIAKGEAGLFQARGQFTLKGRSLELAIPFTARPEGAALRIEGSVPISRLAYKVGEGEWSDTGTLSDQVQVRFNLLVPR